MNKYKKDDICLIGFPYPQDDPQYGKLTTVLGYDEKCKWYDCTTGAFYENELYLNKEANNA